MTNTSSSQATLWAERMSGLQWETTKSILAVTDAGEVVSVPAGESPVTNKFLTNDQGVQYVECVFGSPLGPAKAFLPWAQLTKPRLESVRDLLPAAVHA